MPLAELFATLEDVRSEHDLDRVTAHSRLPGRGALEVSVWRGGIKTIASDGQELKVIPTEARAS
jgi:hypothetical protein